MYYRQLQTSDITDGTISLQSRHHALASNLCGRGRSDNLGPHQGSYASSARMVTAAPPRPPSASALPAVGRALRPYGDTFPPGALAVERSRPVPGAGASMRNTDKAKGRIP